MNSIKYRALAKDGTWRYGCYPRLNVEMGNTKYPMDMFWNNFLSSFRRVTLGQYTGLKDKNDKEIYEGDILHYIYYVEHGQWGEHKDGGNVTVAWNDTNAGFYPMFTWSDYTEQLRRCEVIGNIYENPELLKVSK